MIAMLLRRLRDLIIILFIVGSVMFLILHMIPGSPAIAMIGQYATQDQIDALNERMGFNRPVLEQYGIWLSHLVRGDLGWSYSQNMSVMAAIGAHIGPTLVVAIAATVLGVIVSIPLALHTVARPRALTSRALLALASFGLAVPNFWMALVLVLLLAVNLPIFPVAGYVSPLEDLGRSLWYLALPIFVIMSHQVSLLVMTLRESLASELFNPYIRTARAKGLFERDVFYRHLLPNALLPAVTVVGSNFGSLLGGIIIIETVFLIPGIGWALQNAITARDYNMVLGISLVTAVVFVVVNLVVDIVYSRLDPRVRVQ